MRPDRRRRRAGLRRAAAVLAAGWGLTACSGRGASLGTTSTPCFHALPPAASAVHGQGHLIGVRLVDVPKLRNARLRAALPAKGEVCLVAYSGSYGPATVEHPLDDRSGPYVVVAVRPDGAVVYGSLVVLRLPLTFRHGHTL
jgi:hypothetical protein